MDERELSEIEARNERGECCDCSLAVRLADGCISDQRRADIDTLIAEVRRLQPRRFLLFEHDQYYPSGGTGDKVGEFPSLEEARTAARGHSADDVYVLDVVTGEETAVSWEDRFPEIAAKRNSLHIPKDGNEQ